MVQLIDIRVTTMDTEMKFSIPQNMTGQQLFDQVAKTLGLRETWYFGLKYTDNEQHTKWLKLNKKITGQNVKKERRLQFYFRAKLYPRDMASQVVQDTTLKLFYLQVKKEILTDQIRCTSETAVLLASYALQVKLGDYSNELHENGFIFNDRMLPKSLTEHHPTSAEEWAARISKSYRELSGMMSKDAMREYLKAVQDLETFGMTFFGVKDSEGRPLILGVDAHGLSILSKEDKRACDEFFGLSDIRDIGFADRKFTIKLVDKKVFIFFAPQQRTCEHILDLCKGYHSLYMENKKPETLEVKQIKAEAREDKQAREAERKRLSREIAAREEAESKQRQYEQQMKSLQEMVERLQQDLRDSQTANEQIESERSKLQGITARLEQDKDMEAAEKSKLEREVSAKQLEVQTLTLMVKEKDKETERLQRDFEEARVQLEAASLSQEPSTFQQDNSPDEEAPNDKLDGDDMSSHADDNANLESTVNELCASAGPTIVLQHQLSMDQDEARDVFVESEARLLRRLSVNAARDKHRSIRNIRSGNTRRRVDSFENI